jgi:hypothetical protein
MSSPKYENGGLLELAKYLEAKEDARCCLDNDKLRDSLLPGGAPSSQGIENRDEGFYLRAWMHPLEPIADSRQHERAS